jgi:peptidoglycan/xylan/chitin deacetylase (PgdA/CDA1 family)
MMTVVDSPEETIRSTPPLSVLMYHSASDLGGTPWPELGVPLTLLAEQLGALVGTGLELAGVTEALARRHADPSAPVVAVTFDDAYEDVVPALELVRSLGGTATVYVPTGCLGAKPTWLGAAGEQLPTLTSWSVLQDLQDAGVEIGSHSCRHSQLDLLDPAALDAEVRDSRTALQDRLGAPVASFAYPHGYHSRKVVAAVEAAGYSSATEIGYRRARPGTDDLRLPRLMPLPRHSGEDLLALVQGHGPRAVPLAKRAARPVWRAARRLRARA